MFQAAVAQVRRATVLDACSFSTVLDVLGNCQYPAGLFNNRSTNCVADKCPKFANGASIYRVNSVGKKYNTKFCLRINYNCSTGVTGV